MNSKIDVLAVMARMVRSVGARTDKNRDADLAAAHEARAAVAELIEASHEYFTCYCVDEADDDCATGSGFDTGCTLEQHEAAKRLRAALARVTGA